MTRMRAGVVTLAIVVLLTGCARMRPAPEKGVLTLAENGQSPFVIVVADDASPSTRHGAQELQAFLKEMSGVELPIRSDKESLGAHEIILGNNAHLRRLQTKVDFEALGDEGYLIRTVGPHLVIAGGDLRGTMYGVYGLLEDHLNCRWFTPEVSRIPKRDTLTLPAIDDTQIPALEYREPFTKDCFDGDWCARNRMNSSAASLEEKHGGKVRFGAGMFVHTFNVLMPPEKYFDEHPEYFSLIKGKRKKDHSQLCCTNEDVIRICTEETLKRIRKDPGAFVFSVSQNDWHNYCQCPKCTALAEAEGSQMAPVLQLVNRVAEAVEKEFPGKAIETLAYQYTRKPCKTLRPRDNVIIRLCSIECCFMHPLATCDQRANREFREDAEAWAKVADRLWVWDYVTSFRDYLVPFPNLRVRDDNIRFFIKNNVTGIFEQDVYNTPNGELSGLSGYLNAKLLWNPDYNEDQAINEFLEGVYGDAAKPIRQYLDMLHDRVAKKNIHSNIWVTPVSAPYLTDRLVEKSMALWDKAEAAVADQPAVLDRVEIARLAVDHAWIERFRTNADAIYITKHSEFRIEPRPEFQKQVTEFMATARRANVTLIDEHRVPLNKYEEGLKDIIDGKTQAFTPLDPVAEPGTGPGLNCAFYEGEWEALPKFEDLKPAREIVAKGIGLAPAREANAYALVFTGYIQAQEDGIYHFSLNSNDGSRLTVGSKALIDNDGLHAEEVKSGSIGLRTGWHPIRLEYFQAGGGAALELAWEGPGFEKGAILRKDLRQKN